MRKLSILLFCILLFTIGIFAKKSTTNFTGIWELDLSASELSEHSSLKSMTMNVTQTKKEILLKIESKMNDDEIPARGIRIKLSAKGKNGKVIYKLDGSETESELDGEVDGTLMRKGRIAENGSVILTKTLNINFQGNEITSVTTETWELSDKGKTLTISREIETSRGTQNSELVFTKK